MRRVFAKEWLQGRMILLFGLLMGGLVTVLWGIFTVAYVKNVVDQLNVNGFCGAMFYLVPLSLAVFVGAGLFAAEVERGTMPLLLALPFSRRQVWAGKTIAGLALMLSAVAMTIVPGVIATRPALEEVAFWQFLPDLALASTLLYFGALFWSTVLTTIVNAFLSAIVTGIGLVLVAVVMMVFGGRLFGPPLLDIEVWALAAIPGLIAGSYLAFVRGEAFLGRRRWRAPLVMVIAVYLVTMVAVVGLARSMTRYDRSQVYRLDGATITGDGSVVTMRTFGSPAKVTREAEIHLLPGGDQGYPRMYAVALDLDTGKELLTRREAGPIAVSPDGKHAVVLTQLRALTWRGESIGWGWPIVEIWDLTRKRMTYRGVPVLPTKGAMRRFQQVRWSPDSKWISMATQEESFYGGAARIFFLGLDGVVRRELVVIDRFDSYTLSQAWDYAPTGDTVYAVSPDGVLERHDLATGKLQEIWTIKAASLDPKDWFLWANVAVSPDGRHIAMSLSMQPNPEHYVPTSNHGAKKWRFFFLVFKIEGRETRIVYKEEGPRSVGPLLWSHDGRTLYRVASIAYDRQTTAAPVTTWRVGESETRSITLPTPGYSDAALLQDNRLLVRRFLDKRNEAWLFSPDGRLVAVARRTQEALDKSYPVGVDKRGRLIVSKGEGMQPNYLAALDVDTGKLTKVYP